MQIAPLESVTTILTPGGWQPIVPGSLWRGGADFLGEMVPVYTYRQLYDADSDPVTIRAAAILAVKAPLVEEVLPNVEAPYDEEAGSPR
jgi:hypothetical protein